MNNTIQEFFEQQVELTPNAIAIVFEEQKLTYSYINEKANQLAYIIRKEYHSKFHCTLASDTIIGFCCGRSHLVVISILAILKSGAGYVALDPDTPKERLNYIINDVNPVFMLTESAYREIHCFANQNVLCLDECLKKQNTNNISLYRNLQNISNANDIAYIIYTSGSTGKPKGVVIEHASVINLAKANKTHFKINANTKALQFASINFDASVWEIFPAIFYGATLYIVDSETRYSGEKLFQYLYNNEISLATIPPAILTTMPEKALPKLSYLIIAGETCPHKVIQYWCQNRYLINAYGPTENTVCATLAFLNEKSSPNLIGKPLNGIECYVLDDQLNKVGSGIIGNLYVGGVGLAREYYKNADLTKKCFIKLFQASLRLYKTGDLVKLNDDGNIEYIGRNDFQVKIRGFRVELGEIEKNILAFKNMQQVIVLYKDLNDTKSLVAYFIADELVSIKELKSYLENLLPQYMVPNFYVQLDEFKLNINGKIDRQALSEINLQILEHKNYVLPRNEVELLVADIWQKVLHIERIGIDDDFFSFGGTSLNSANIIHEIQAKLNIECSPISILKYPTIQQWYDHIYIHLEKRNCNISTVEQSSQFPLSVVQEYFYYHEKTYGKEVVFNEQFTVNIYEHIDKNILELAINLIVSRHPQLRTSFFEDSCTKRNLQQTIEDLSVKLMYHDYSNFTNPIFAYKEKARSLAEYRFNLLKPPLIRFNLFKINKQHYKVFCVFHRICADGTSIYNIFLPEIQYFYKKLSENSAIDLPQLDYTYSDFVRYYDAISKDSFRSHQDFWKNFLNKYTPTKLLSTSNIINNSKSGGILPFCISDESTVLIRDLAKREKVSLFTVILSFFYLTIAKLTKNNKICIGTVLHGRDRYYFKSVFGVMFEGTLLAIEIDDNMSFAKLLKKVHNANLSVLSKTIPFDELLKIYRQHLAKNNPNILDTPIYETDIIYTAFSLEPREMLNNEWEINQLEAHSGTSPCDFYLELDEKDKQILGRIEYKRTIYSIEYIEEFLTIFMDNIILATNQESYMVSFN